MGLPPTPALTVDCVICDPQGRVLLIRRKNEPFQNAYALPGGFVDVGETVEAGCRREILEETGLEVAELKLVGVYSDPSRDPRGHTVSVAFLTLLPDAAVPTAGDDAEAAVWVVAWREQALAFDHSKILEDAEKLRGTARPG